MTIIPSFLTSWADTTGKVKLQLYACKKNNQSNAFHTSTSSFSTCTVQETCVWFTTEKLQGAQLRLYSNFLFFFYNAKKINVLLYVFSHEADIYIFLSWVSWRFGSFVILLNVLLDQNYVVKSWQSSKSASRYTVDIHGTQRMNPNDCGQLLAFFWVELLGWHWKLLDWCTLLVFKNWT